MRIAFRFGKTSSFARFAHPLAPPKNRRKELRQRDGQKFVFPQICQFADNRLAQDHILGFRLAGKVGEEWMLKQEYLSEMLPEVGSQRGPADGLARPFVSLIVPVFNCEQGLRRCLEALTQQSYPAAAYEVLVVDNSGEEPSSDSLVKLIADFPGTVLLREPQPGSYAARNRGLVHAQGDIIALTDADCIPDRTWLAEGVQALTDNTGLAMLGGQVVLFPENTDRLTLTERLELATGFPQRTYIEQHHFSATANLFAQRWVFDRVGLFDSRFLSGGDRDWGRRVVAHGLQQQYAERVCVRHPARRSKKAWLAKWLRLTGGAYEAVRRGDPPLRRWLANRLLSPLRKYRAFRHHPLFQSPVVRLQAFLFIAAVQAVMVCEFVRLACGGRPRRQ